MKEQKSDKGANALQHARKSFATKE